MLDRPFRIAIRGQDANPIRLWRQWLGQSPRVRYLQAFVWQREEGFVVSSVRVHQDDPTNLLASWGPHSEPSLLTCNHVPFQAPLDTTMPPNTKLVLVFEFPPLHDAGPPPPEAKVMIDPDPVLSERWQDYETIKPKGEALLLPEGPTWAYWDYELLELSREQLEALD